MVTSILRTDVTLNVTFPGQGRVTELCGGDQSEVRMPVKWGVLTGTLVPSTRDPHRLVAHTIGFNHALGVPQLSQPNTGRTSERTR